MNRLKKTRVQRRVSATGRARWLAIGWATMLIAGLPLRSGAQDSTSAGASQTPVSPEDQIIAQAAQQQGSAWSLGLGLAVSDPGYVGVNRQITPLPLVFYHNGRFFLAGVSAGYVAFSGAQYSFTLLVKPRINRLSASDSSQLTGIQSRKWSIDGGARFSLFGDWGRINAGLYSDLLHRYNGMEADLEYQHPIRMTGWSLSPGLGIAWYNSPLTNYYYGVSPAETAPGRPAYSPGRAANPFVQLSLRVPFASHWQFLGSARYLHFARSIQDSPIVDRSNTLTLFLGISYRFDSH